jgi:hypothetical protein
VVRKIVSSEKRGLEDILKSEKRHQNMISFLKELQHEEHKDFQKALEGDLKLATEISSATKTQANNAAAKLEMIKWVPKSEGESIRDAIESGLSVLKC